MSEVWVALFLLSNPDKIDEPIGLVHPQGLRNVTLTARDRTLQAPGLKIVEVKLAPVIALREPNDLIRAWKKSPVRAVLPALEIGRDSFLDDVSDASLDSISYTKSSAFVVA